MASTARKGSIVKKKVSPRKKKIVEEPEKLDKPLDMPKPESVAAAVKAEVDALPLSLQSSALALTAIHLADILTQTTAARDSASLAKELRAVLADIKIAKANALDSRDSVDELGERRKNRRTAAGM